MSEPEHQPITPTRADLESMDPDYPIRSTAEAVAILAEWDRVNGDRVLAATQYYYYLTHGHAHEWPDIVEHGYALGYIRSKHTKHVSIGWHLAGRYDQDIALRKIIAESSTPLAIIDFGAGPLIQSCMFAKKGCRVTSVNQDVESECHRFGRFLAQRHEVTPAESSVDGNWRDFRYDVVYAIDVLEHIVPEPDGSPGWPRFAADLYRCLRPGGIWYVNSPIKKQPLPCVPDPDHEFHFTAPFTVEEWAAEQGMVHGPHGLLQKPPV